MTGTRNIDAFFNFERQAGEDAEKVTKEVVVVDTKPNVPIQNEDANSLIIDLTQVSQHEKDMDQLAETAMEAYEEIMEYGKAADERNCALIFTVAVQMMKNALDAKTSKNSARLRAADMLFKKKKYDDTAEMDEAEVVDNESDNIVTNRNKIMDAINKGK